MINYCRPYLFFAIFVVFFILPSCAQIKSTLSPQTTVETPQTSVQATQVANQLRTQAKRYMATGEYQKAMDTYRIGRKDHPDNQILVRDYIKSLEEIKITADRALDKKDFGSAGKIHSALLKNYPDFKVFAHMLSFNSAQLTLKLGDCKTALSKNGFQEYRASNLSEAISLWEDYLAIDPNNADIRKALNTARTQQKHL